MENTAVWFTWKYEMVIYQPPHIYSQFIYYCRFFVLFFTFRWNVDAIEHGIIGSSLNFRYIENSHKTKQNRPTDEIN